MEHVQAVEHDHDDVVELKGAPVVLVADDEDLMREVVCMMIEDAGGEVIEAENGEQAVDLFTKRAGNIDCVFLDFSMPGLNGFQAYQKIREANGKVPIVIMSGLKITPEVEASWRKGDLDYLGKPFDEDALLGMLRKKLDQ